MSDLLPPPITTTTSSSFEHRRQPNEYPLTPDHMTSNGLPPSLMQQFQNQPQHQQPGTSSGSPHLHSRAIIIDSPSLGSSSGGGSYHPLSNPNHMGEQGFIPDTQRVTRAFGLRVIRTVRRGQLPFLLVFFTCVIIFFSALSGYGYVEPSSSTSSSDYSAGTFNPGQPVHDNLVGSHGAGAGGLGAVEEEKVRKMKLLEEQWARQKRPKDGAWMKSNRNQREVRRKPLADSRFQRQRQQQQQQQEPVTEEEDSRSEAGDDLD